MPQHIINITVTKEIGEQLQGKKLKGVTIKNVSCPDEEQVARFGIAETLALIALAKGTLELIKIGLEVWKLLSAQVQKTGDSTLSAKLSTPDERGIVSISAEMTPDEVKKQIRHVFEKTE